MYFIGLCKSGSSETWGQCRTKPCDSRIRYCYNCTQQPRKKPFKLFKNVVLSWSIYLKSAGNACNTSYSAVGILNCRIYRDRHSEFDIFSNLTNSLGHLKSSFYSAHKLLTNVSSLRIWNHYQIRDVPNIVERVLKVLQLVIRLILSAYPSIRT